MGPAAYEWVEFLARAGQSYWQILPLNATEPGRGNNPYSSFSAFALNPLLISPDLLVRDGLLDAHELEPRPTLKPQQVLYEDVTHYKQRLFELAAERFFAKVPPDFQTFCQKQAYWLEDMAIYAALRRKRQGQLWCDWPNEIRERAALSAVPSELQKDVEREKFLQYLAFGQWARLRAHCARHEIKIFGDLPIYVDLDSADVWAHPKLFKLDSQRRPLAVSGVPPDYFSANGQLWGNPVYDWPAIKERGYEWWLARLAHTLALFDLVRIDHFRAMAAYWEVAAGETTAINGQWVPGPADGLFDAARARFGQLPIVAEDLGIITDDVRALMQRQQFPGMKVLQFAFSNEPDNPYLPHNHIEDCLVYTGTHDNNTARGWYENDLDAIARGQLSAYLGFPVDAASVSEHLMRMAMRSVAKLCVIPWQDVLALPQEFRMNRPGTCHGNFEWQMAPGQLSDKLAASLFGLTRLYNRL